MRKVRTFILIFSIGVFIVFAGVRIWERRTSDYVPPVITSEEDAITVSVTATDEELMEGVTALDNLDGDVTDTLVVASKSKFITRGTLKVNYAAFDNDNNVGTYSRTVTFADYVPPHFILTEPMRFLSGSTSYAYLTNITAEDCLDGDITRQIKMNTGTIKAVNDNVTERQVNLQVTNSAGDTSVLSLTARFEDYGTYNQYAPSLSTYVVYTKVGSGILPARYLNGIWSGGNVLAFSATNFTASSDIVIDAGEVDYRTPGVYTVTYQLYSHGDQPVSERSRLGTAELIVIVEE